MLVVVGKVNRVDQVV